MNTDGFVNKSHQFAFELEAVYLLPWLFVIYHIIVGHLIKIEFSVTTKELLNELIITPVEFLQGLRNQTLLTVYDQWLNAINIVVLVFTHSS